MAATTQVSQDREIVPPVSLTKRAVDFWWVEIPAKLRRYSLFLWTAWSDGIYLTAWPRVAIILPLAVFAFGFLEGGTHWSYRTIVGSNGFAGNLLAPAASADGYGGPTRIVFAEILHLLVVAVAVGTLSANLGLTLVTGYALGDLLWAGAKFQMHSDLPSTQIFVYQHLPRLASYLLFVLVAVMPTVMSNTLVKSMYRRAREIEALRIALAASVQALLVFAWTYMAPMVFRTVWLWPGSDPRIQVPYYHDVTVPWLIPAAVLAVVARELLMKAAQKKEPVLVRMGVLLRQASGARSRIPLWLKGIASAGLITLLLSGFFRTPSDRDPGLFQNFIEAEVVFFAITIALLVRYYELPRLELWRRWIQRMALYPPLIRLGIATVSTYLICTLILELPGAQNSSPGQFGPELTAILMGLFLTMILLPQGFAPVEDTANDTDFAALLALAHSRMARTTLSVFLVLVFTKNVFADCYDFWCCFLGSVASAAAAVGGLIPSLAGLLGGLLGGSSGEDGSGPQNGDNKRDNPCAGS